MPKSVLIKISDELMQFMKDYKKSHYVSMQDFVERAATEKMQEIKIRRELEDIQLKNP